jgi:hypothetical protein
MPVRDVQQKGCGEEQQKETKIRMDDYVRKNPCEVPDHGSSSVFSRIGSSALDFKRGFVESPTISSPRTRLASKE